jgi:hypothetical protein
LFCVPLPLRKKFWCAINNGAGHNSNCRSRGCLVDMFLDHYEGPCFGKEIA